MKKVFSTVAALALLMAGAPAHADKAAFSSAYVHGVFSTGGILFGMGSPDYGVLPGLTSTYNLKPTLLTPTRSPVMYVDTSQVNTVVVMQDGTAAYAGFNFSTRKKVSVFSPIPGATGVDEATLLERSIVYLKHGKVYTWDYIPQNAATEVKGLENITSVSGSRTSFLALDKSGKAYLVAYSGPNWTRIPLETGH